MTAPEAPLRQALSLRGRLLAATLVGLLLALLLAGALLQALFREQVMRQFQQDLSAQLDQVTARLVFGPDGQPQLAARALSDPRWTRPYSGLYWQIDRVADGGLQRGVLRSRSLWDHTLQLAHDTLPDGKLHVHEAQGPQGLPLLLLERTVRPEDSGPTPWRLVVAADLSRVQDAVARFRGALLASLAMLGLLLGAAAWAWGRVGLQPLQALQAALQATRRGRTPRLQGRFPGEVQPLVDAFNAVLDQQAEGLQRARSQAGNLAHAIKTPLAVLQQAASRAGPAQAELARLVAEQVDAARQQVDWHLARSRAAASAGLPGQRAAVAPLLAGLVRTLQRVHADRALQVHIAPLPADLAFAGEAQDLQEMLGNLLDNACKWARSEVDVQARLAAPGLPGGHGSEAATLQLTVEDDGPGVAPERRLTVLQRGARLDEAVPGSGLGLSIVQELAGLYGGSLVLGEASLGGLRATLSLPAAAP